MIVVYLEQFSVQSLQVFLLICLAVHRVISLPEPSPPQREILIVLCSPSAHLRNAIYNYDWVNTGLYVNICRCQGFI